MESLEYTLEDAEQFWAELSEIVTLPPPPRPLDGVLSAYLHFTTRFRNDYLSTREDLELAARQLLQGDVFRDHAAAAREALVQRLIAAESFSDIHVLATLLLLDGRENEATFELMIREGCFPRLLLFIRQAGEDKPSSSALHLLLSLQYEMSRCLQLSLDDLRKVDDAFVQCLFAMIEELSDDAEDPYHYLVIRVLLVLNEQFMIASTSSLETQSQPLTNRVIKLLSLQGSSFMTFGENLILLLNRETETSLQLLILKLLYLLFTTPATYEYFYTNDLRVLLDVIVRNLLDLPNEPNPLRHTYLRVLYPLLEHTQLNQPPYYKRDEVLKLLSSMNSSENSHWGPADDTTIRLVDRISKVQWLQSGQAREGEVARKLLGMSLSLTQTTSNSSVLDVALVSEKPGIQTPRRQPEFDQGIHEDASHSSIPPSPPLPIPSSKTKKPPPKTPPRRRTRLKNSASSQPESSSQ